MQTRQNYITISNNKKHLPTSSFPIFMFQKWPQAKSVYRDLYLNKRKFKKIKVQLRNCSVLQCPVCSHLGLELNLSWDVFLCLWWTLSVDSLFVSISSGHRYVSHFMSSCTASLLYGHFGPFCLNCFFSLFFPNSIQFAYLTLTLN